MPTATTDVLSLCAAVFVLLLILLRAAPGEQRKLLSIGGWFGVSVVAGALGAIAAAFARPDAANILISISVLGAGSCLIRLVGVGVFHVALPAVRMSFARLFQEVAVAAAVVLWMVAWLRSHHSIELGALIAPSAVVTAVLGLSLQDTLGNIIGGAALQFEDSVRVGDWVKVDDMVGRVTETHWRYTAVETRNWETVVIPNSQLLKAKFMVLGRRQGQPVQQRRWIWFNVDFRWSPPQVTETVVKALLAAQIPNVAETPRPSCVLMEMGESYGHYAARYWLTDLFVDDPTDSEVRAHIFFALKRAGIQLSMPAHALFITKENESRKQRKQEAAQADREAVVRGIEIFKSLKDDEVGRVARRLQRSPFFRGDVMTRQGAQAHWLYIITEGAADVVVERPDGTTTKVSEMGPGSFFGEMGLLTGAPRSATVIARSAVECYRLDKEAFQEILAERPALAEEISHIIAQRMEAQRRMLAESGSAAPPPPPHHDLIARIRSFFGLHG